ncbi:hypothetical protein [Aestuariirhabdus sp. LZHN29]|uniref:hypothetical protein n=1 Tax=Aestuariirhabdus sp. LZHN29 TaxID=3417462 RepID=UPI003CE9FB1A
MRNILLLLSGLLLWTNGYAETVSHELAEQSLQKSGIELFLKQTPIMLDHLLRAQNARTEEEQVLLRQASERLQQQITFEQLHQRLVNRLLQSGHSDYLKQMNAALDSPLAKAMNEREKQAGSADGRQRLEEYREKVQLNPPRGTRVELVKRLDNASRTSQISVMLREQLTLSIRHAAEVLTQRPDGENPGAKELDQQVHEQLVKASRQQVESFFLYSYRQVPTAQLEQYVLLYEADATRWFMDQCLDAMREFFTNQRNSFATRP